MVRRCRRPYSEQDRFIRQQVEEFNYEKDSLQTWIERLGLGTQLVVDMESHL